MKQATNVLLGGREDRDRYELFNNAGVKNIKAFKSSARASEGALGDDFNEEYTPRHGPTSCSSSTRWRT